MLNCVYCCMALYCNKTNKTSQNSNLQAKEAKTVEEVTGYTVTCFDESDTELRDLRGTHTHTHTPHTLTLIDYGWTGRGASSCCRVRTLHTHTHKHTHTHTHNRLTASLCKQCTPRTSGRICRSSFLKSMGHLRCLPTTTEQVCLCVCVCACLCLSLHACVCACVCVFAGRTCGLTRVGGRFSVSLLVCSSYMLSIWFP